jgi:Uma2 family endonuclease
MAKPSLAMRNTPSAICNNYPMPRPEPAQKVSFEEYLLLEQSSPIRHEFVDGYMFAMAGSKDNHNAITLNIAALARAKARGSGCSVYISDMKLRTPGGETYYPDVFATCDETNDGSAIKHTACFVVEVLSQSTADLDRSEKLLNYRKIAGLKMYVLVSQQQRLIETYSRLDDGSWRYDTFEGEGELKLPCLELRLSLAQVYEDVVIQS